MTKKVSDIRAAACKNIARNDEQEAALVDIRSATIAARSVFRTTAPTAEMVGGCVFRIFSLEAERDQRAALEQLVESRRLVEALVEETSSPSLVSDDEVVEMTFLFFDAIYGEDDEDDGHWNH